MLVALTGGIRRMFMLGGTMVSAFFQASLKSFKSCKGSLSRFICATSLSVEGGGFVRFRFREFALFELSFSEFEGCCLGWVSGVLRMLLLEKHIEDYGFLEGVTGFL